MTPHKESKSLPALDRGLRILDQLIRSESPVRYNELRASLPGIQDSTLSRILKALEAYGYVSRDPEIGYSITRQVSDWSTYLTTGTPALSALAQKEVERLTERGNESAAVVLFRNDRIETLSSRSLNGGIQVLKEGDLLHFEEDHAAALAILNQLPANKRKTCLQGSHSRFPKKYAFRQLIEEMRQDDGCLIDQSRERPGVCRMAHAFEHKGQTGAIFFCLTQEACRSKLRELSPLLREAAVELQA